MYVDIVWKITEWNHLPRNKRLLKSLANDTVLEHWWTMQRHSPMALYGADFSPRLQESILSGGMVH